MLNRINNFVAMSIAALIFTVIASCDAALSPEEKREKARAAIGIDASATAAIAVSASRSCQIVGVNDIQMCKQLKGSSLIADQTAQVNAQLALDMTKSYSTKCQINFSQDYCLALLQRALDIENRKQRIPE